eukprot:15450957-Alexandrium_andersonii.AAC.2
MRAPTLPADSCACPARGFPQLQFPTLPTAQLPSASCSFGPTRLRFPTSPALPTVSCGCGFRRFQSVLRRRPPTSTSSELATTGGGMQWGVRAAAPRGESAGNCRTRWRPMIAAPLALAERSGGRGSGPTSLWSAAPAASRRR